MLPNQLKVSLCMPHRCGAAKGVWKSGVKKPCRPHAWLQGCIPASSRLLNVYVPTIVLPQVVDITFCNWMNALPTFRPVILCYSCTHMRLHSKNENIVHCTTSSLCQAKAFDIKTELFCVHELQDRRAQC